MKNSLLFLVFSVLVFLATMGGGCYYDNNTYLHPDIACDTTAVMSFANDIMPILNNTCGTNDSCHGSNNTSGIALSNYDGVKQMADSGKLLSAVIWDGNASQMPQGSLEQIDGCSQAKIRRWIAEGAPNN